MKPIIKWVGGKSQLADKLLSKMPQNILIKLKDPQSSIRYFEPFLGGGAVTFVLAPTNAYLNDINFALINMYNAVKYHLNELINLINDYDTDITSKKYYALRNVFNQKLLNLSNINVSQINLSKINSFNINIDIELAALFIFLNKHGFNGLFRVNKNGEFNVPFNQSNRSSININNLSDVSNYLQNVHLFCGDFINITQLVQPDDFVFIDSPYPPLKDKTFSEYNAIKFSNDDHIRLAHEVIRLDKLHAYVMITNHDTPLIRSLYSQFNIDKVTVSRNINSVGTNRKSEEIIITNF